MFEHVVILYFSAEILRMHFFQSIYDWLIGFFGLKQLLKIIASGDYRSFSTYDGFISIIRPLFPVVLIFEIIVGLIYKKFKVINFKISFFSYVLNAFIGRFISIGAIVFCIGLFQKFAIFHSTLTWYWFIYSYVVWEFGHFIYHYLGHKVRLFWCLHSTHHAPESMSLSISYAHFFLEGPYADVIRTTTCILLGVNPATLFIIMFIDGVWGGFIHIGEHMVKDARFGFLNKFILTPSHHRVHHAKNPLYMDTNFCNLLNIWDRVFGTYQLEEKNMPIVYGISRPMRPNSFLDAYFGEFVALAKDVKRAPGLKNKILYIINPPGWDHTGNHKTARIVKDEFVKGKEAPVSN